MAISTARALLPVTPHTPRLNPRITIALLQLLILLRSHLSHLILFIICLLSSITPILTSPSHILQVSNGLIISSPQNFFYQLWIPPHDRLMPRADPVIQGVTAIPQIPATHPVSTHFTGHLWLTFSTIFSAIILLAFFPSNSPPTPTKPTNRTAFEVLMSHPLVCSE